MPATCLTGTPATIYARDDQAAVAMPRSVQMDIDECHANRRSRPAERSCRSGVSWICLFAHGEERK
ncbi:hypothetical protein GCM10010411_56250 [Actinomadura fulvescens]|uniref:Uncharacterized protein n=1 Tax=Actinomadura fulvescens TaxID=46160 RepID=A0ABP6CCZ9_9ACTN